MKDGKTAREHVAAFAARDPVNGAAELAALPPQPVPPCAAHAVAAFESLSAGRGASMSGPRALSLSDVSSYATLVAPLTPRDVSWVLTMDRAFLEAAANG
jgi:hypothetical protein